MRSDIRSLETGTPGMTEAARGSLGDLGIPYLSDRSSVGSGQMLERVQVPTQMVFLSGQLPLCAARVSVLPETVQV